MQELFSEFLKTKYVHSVLSLLTWPPCISRMLNVGGWNSLPGIDARGALVTIHIWLHPTLYLHPAWPPPKLLWSFCHIIISVLSAPNILSLSLQLWFFLTRILPPFHRYLPHPHLHDGRQYMSIDVTGYCLPQDLHQDNPSKVGASQGGRHGL